MSVLQGRRKNDCMAQVVVVLVTDRRKLASEVVICGDDVKLGYSNRHASEELKAKEVAAESVSIKRGALPAKAQRREAKRKRDRLRSLLAVEQGTGGGDRRRNVEMRRRHNARGRCRAKDATVRGRQGVCSCAEKGKGGGRERSLMG